VDLQRNKLYAPDRSRHRDAEPWTLSRKTGRYTLSVPPGKFWVQVANYTAAGRRATTPDRFRVKVPAAGTNVTRYFGLTRRTLITGTVYLDANRNGTKDAGDRGLGGVAVFLDTDGDGVAQLGDPHVLTDGAGHFTFDNLPPGTYRIGVFPIAGFLPSGLRTARLSTGTAITSLNFAQKLA
jgi:large repetitive protein